MEIAKTTYKSQPEVVVIYDLPKRMSVQDGESLAPHHVLVRSVAELMSALAENRPCVIDGGCPPPPGEPTLWGVAMDMGYMITAHII